MILSQGITQTFLTHVTWANAINGTLLSQADWDTNYTANDAAWRLDTDTFKANYSAFLALPTLAEIIGFGYYNSTDFSIGDYYLKSNPLVFIIQQIQYL